MKAENIIEVLDKLIGRVEPVAESTQDAKRLENLKVYIEVFNHMHLKIDGIAHLYKDSPYHSAKLIGELADKHIDSMGIQ